MLTPAVADRARSIVDARLPDHDETLDDALGRMAERVKHLDDEEEILRYAVQLRLLCEEDLQARAKIISKALVTAHRDLDGVRREGLIRGLRAQLAEMMADGSLHLADALRQHSEKLKPLFLSQSAIDAEWLAKQRNMASDQVGRVIQEYAAGLQYPLLDRMRRFLGIRTS